MKKLLVAGYCSIDRIVKLDKDPKIGHTSLIINNDSIKPYFGGCSINIATILSKIGMSATPIVRVGQDFETSGFKEFLEANHVDLSLTTKIDSETTSHSYLLETKTGNHVTLFHPGAMAGSHFSKYDETDFKNAKMLILTINSYEDNKHLLKLAKKYQIPLALGMKLDKDGFPKALLLEILNEIKILFANEEEVKEILKLYNYQNIKELFNNDKLEIIVMTQGSKGSLIVTKDQEVKVYPFKDVKIVDTAGAGDAYIAGFIYGYFNNYSLEECGKLGSVMSSFILETVGCTTNIPSNQNFMTRYKKY